MSGPVALQRGVINKLTKGFLLLQTLQRDRGDI